MTMKKVLLLICFLLMISGVVYAEDIKITLPLENAVYSDEDVTIQWSGSGQYLMTLMDLDLNQQKIAVQVSGGSYVINKNQLIAGHRYKVILSSDGQSSEVTFSVLDIITEKMDEPKISSPYFGQSFAYGNISVDWNDCHLAQYYYVMLQDLTDDVMVINNADTGSSEYLIDKSYLKFGHKYKVTVTAKRDQEMKWTETVFTIDPMLNYPLAKPNFEWPVANNKISLDDLLVEWQLVGADDYELSLKDVTAGTMVFSGVKESDGDYLILKSLLKEGHQYLITVTATKKGESDSGMAEFELKSSAEAYFTVKENVTLAPTVKYPKSNASIVGSVSSITWTGLNGRDHYLITLKDLTTGKYLLDREVVNFTHYDFEYRDFEMGHSYKVAVAGVKDGKEYWSESYFNIIHNDFRIPEFKDIKDGDEVPYDDLFLSWTNTLNIDYYLLTLRDITDGTIIIDELKTDHTIYKVAKTQLKPGHEYEALAVTFRDSDYVSDTVKFYVEYKELSGPVLDYSKEVYPYDNIELVWKPVKGATEYYVSLQDLSDKSMAVDKVKVEGTSYKILKSVLKDYTNYRLVLHASNGKLESTNKYDFMVSSQTDDITYDVSDWAKPFVLNVDSKKLIPETLFDEMMTSPKSTLTRVEFCELMLAVYDRYNQPAKTVGDEVVNYKDISHLSSDKQEVVRRATSLGITSGMDEYTFNPDALINRQMMAVMLLQTYEAMYGELNRFDHYEAKHAFIDKNEISLWALEAVEFTDRLGLLTGSEDKFMPIEGATREQAMILIVKIFENVE